MERAGTVGGADSVWRYVFQPGISSPGQTRMRVNYHERVFVDSHWLSLTPAKREKLSLTIIKNFILGDPWQGAVKRGVRKINRRDERFDESLQGVVKEPLGTDSYQTISKRLGECWLLIGQKNPPYYSAQSASISF